MEKRSPKRKRWFAINISRFGCSTVPGYEKAISNVWGPKSGEQIVVPALDTVQRKAVRMLCPEQRSNFLLRELFFRLCLPRDFVLNHSAGGFSAAVACFTVFCHWVLVDAGLIRSALVCKEASAEVVSESCIRCWHGLERRLGGSRKR